MSVQMEEAAGFYSPMEGSIGEIAVFSVQSPKMLDWIIQQIGMTGRMNKVILELKVDDFTNLSSGSLPSKRYVMFDFIQMCLEDKSIKTSKEGNWSILVSRCCLNAALFLLLERAQLSRDVACLVCFVRSLSLHLSS